MTHLAALIPALVPWLLAVAAAVVLIGMASSTDGRPVLRVLFSPITGAWRDLAAEFGPVLATRTGRGVTLQLLAFLFVIVVAGDALENWALIVAGIVFAAGWLLVYVGRKGAAGPVFSARDLSPGVAKNGGPVAYGHGAAHDVRNEPPRPFDPERRGGGFV